MITVRTMRESDIAEATRIFRLAFGTFLGLPEPTSFAPGREYIATRFHAYPDAALTAEDNGRIIGSNMVTIWGSFGFFGPITILPEYWDKGAASALLGPTMEIFRTRGVREAGLFTFVQSPKHLALYQKFGFWPGFLIGVMGRQVIQAQHWSRLATADWEGCRVLANELFEGLDLSGEIRSTENQGLGETVVVRADGTVTGFAVCHCGAGTEAGPGNCYIKFATARSRDDFERLLKACEGLAFDHGLEHLEAGVNFERLEAYQTLLADGFRVERQALAMSRDGIRAYNRRDAYALDDWR